MSRKTGYLTFGLLSIIIIAAGFYLLHFSQKSGRGDGLVVLQSGVADSVRPLISGHMSAFSLFELPYKAPDSAFYDEVKGELRFSDFKGRVLLVNLWATWCGPCRAEMPSIDRLQSLRQSADFEIVTISLDGDGSFTNIKAFFDEFKITKLPAYLDKDLNLPAGFASIGLPNSYIIDNQGYVVGKLAGGASWDSDDAVKLVDYFIAKGSITKGR